mmetsp:Transcript_28890/g.81354  ORF Transcript_28890/g.81354 Transcript_28890/m.81354 type:complete len:320 (+) Transcript_28890:191-1150(+)
MLAVGFLWMRAKDRETPVAWQSPRIFVSEYLLDSVGMNTTKMLMHAAIALFLAAAVCGEETREQNISGTRVQFASKLPMERILNTKVSEGRGLFQLRMLPLHLSKKYLTELAIAAKVHESSIDIFDVFSDGEMLHVFTRIAFPNPDTALKFHDLIEDGDLSRLSNDVEIERSTVKLLLAGQLDETTDSERRAAVGLTVYVLEEEGRGNSGASDVGGLPAWAIALISVLSVFAATAVVGATLVCIGRKGRKRKAGSSPRAEAEERSLHMDDRSFLTAIAEDEPLNVQCTDSATCSQKPTLNPDFQPPVPPSAPPAGMIMK